ncbi:DNA-binding transcriptional activator of the SARP family [Geodermatophilus obscurus]|uniref:DNA-binding transcriptional activator of the SARP family n=1 Tax=Geodermatophilus obscurus TaxID=1861 RepID=A0A1I5HP01_9ACTN|nr:BTAD domain-containing putative transcriptional regulator [Geodermatophilus obscurus]SFO50025.1 DNA-binding transcriptional activator of the SARP family [Geodermatophilus obscurus]
MTVELVDALAARCEKPGHPMVHLLGRPYVSQRAVTCTVGDGGLRLLAFLAINRDEHERRVVASRLWPDVDEVRAAGNLRSALWRLNSLGVTLVRVDKSCLGLRGSAQVDVHLLEEWAARLITGARRPADLAVLPSSFAALEMLPGWYDDWAVFERERLRQRLLHAVECMSRELVAVGRYAEAVEAALVAVSADPLRESAQRVLIEAHLAEGNWCEATTCFTEHRRLIGRELGVEPSAALASLIAPGRRRSGAAWHPPRPDGHEWSGVPVAQARLRQPVDLNRVGPGAG